METTTVKLHSIMNIPNILTISRVLSVPVFIVLMHDPSPLRVLSAGIVFTLASATDWLDGYLARKWGQVTKMGKLLDPIADKIMVASALVILVRMEIIPEWIAIVIIGREFAVTGLRSIAASDGIVMPAETVGKYKVVSQILAVQSVLLDYYLGTGWLNEIGIVIIWISMALSAYSGVSYFRQYWSKLS